MLRDGRELVPTAKAFQLMTLLRGLGVEELTQPELTGNWEYQLAEMEHGRLQRDAFMAEIAKMAERIVRKAKEYDRDTIPGDYATLATPCPNCGGVVKENYRRFACTGAKASSKAAASRSPRSPAAAAFEMAEVGGCCATRRSARSRASARRPAGPSRPSSSWPSTTRSTTGSWSSTSATTRSAEGESGEPVDFSDQQSLGACPKCQGHVYEHGTNYVCEHAVGAHVTCDFKSGKIILQQPVAREQMSKLLSTGKTEPAGELRLQQDAAQVQGLPGLRQEGRQGELRVRAAARQGCRQSRREDIGCQKVGIREGGLTPLFRWVWRTIRRMKTSALRLGVALVLAAACSLAQANLVFAINEGVTYRVPNDEIRARYATIAADLSKLLKQPVMIEPVADYPSCATAWPTRATTWRWCIRRTCRSRRSRSRATSWWW